MKWWKILLITVAVFALGGVGVGWYLYNYADFDIYTPLYADNCSSCHGSDLEGSDQGLALIHNQLKHGDSVDELQTSIRNLHPSFGQPAFAGILTDDEIKGLAIFVGERRMGQTFMNFQFERPVNIPSGVVASEDHNFRVETVAEGLDPLIFSIAPLPDGSILVSEKERGLSTISTDGVQAPLIEGTPETGSSMDIKGIQYGSGWLLDVAIHPDYATNGWVYLHYTDLCGERCDETLMSSSMNRLDRGHIVDGKWVDVETIWQAPQEFYVATPDTGAGGRIAFDDDGHVFISVGIKSSDGTEDTTPQDLTQPYGKIYRVNDDGSIPLDNPFVTSGAADGSSQNLLSSMWTYGHRSPQGLEWHPQRKRIWNSEMGPRGGDEINELIPGKNYGWPYFSKGLEYSGSSVERHKIKSLEFDASDIEQTLVDITPSPAISSFAFYNGDQFPNWRGNVLIGSLKGSTLYRMVFNGREFLHSEPLIKDLARIRDVEIGFDGLIYLLVENKEGSQILRLRPASDRQISQI